MKLVEIKLDKIIDIWEHFVWKYKSIQKQVNFTEEVQTNYAGDIFAYFDDTLPLIDSFLDKSLESIPMFNIIGLLQIIYVHQDLVDELLRIFKLPESTKVDKSPNREIRNELIGHPISHTLNEDGKKLKSSVFFGTEISNSNIHYIKYSIENNFKGIVINYSTKDIISKHENYLIKYLDNILKKLKKILGGFSSKIEEIIAIEKNTAFRKLIEIVDLRFEDIFEQREIFNQNYLLKIEKKKNDHPRYKFALKLFKEELFDSIKGTIKWISELQQNETVDFIEEKRVSFKEISVIDASSLTREKLNVDSENLNYALSKLHSPHPVFRIDYFKGKFKNNPEILSELNHMEKNMGNKLEYYCSYEYLREGILNK